MGPKTFALILATIVACTACQRRSTADDIARSITASVTSTPAGQLNQQQWDDLRTTYTRRNGTPLWVDRSLEKAVAALGVIRSAEAHGLRPSDYSEVEIASALEQVKDDPDSHIDQLASLDVMVTGALLELGHDVALGRLKPEAVNKQWKRARQDPGIAASLEQAASGDLAGWLDSIRPKHPEYAVLQAELKRLRTEGTSSAPPESSAQALSVEDRVARIALSLERWRWLPDDLGARYVMVNIPAYWLVAREGERTALAMKVIVGQQDKPTPVFSAAMTTVVFSPYWNIPDSIIEGEIAMEAARDPGYLRRNNIDILRVSKSGTEEVSASRVNWDDAEELKALAFRQRPGAHNALGHVKFLFPNPYSVYLHDTPADALFNRTERALSHGCIRVEKPEELATLLLQGQSEWDTPRIREAMNAGTEKQVPLRQGVAVHLVYMTAWVDDGGVVQFSPDIYGYDAAQLKLDQKAVR